MKKIIWALIPAISLMAGCGKNENYSTTPKIDFKSFSPASSINVVGNPEVTVNLTFQDGDGDIGRERTGMPGADIFLEYVYDGNNVLFSDSVILPQIPNSATDKNVSGVLGFKVPTTFLIRQGKSEDVVQFKVYLLDKAGHKSNVIVTPELKLNS